MLDKRYQVFISTSGAEMQPERIVLTQTLIGMGFFSWGLEQRTPLSTSFSRRQIDDCDYVMILLGSQYGELSVSGVGYMHLEYLYAKQQQKKILVILHDDPDIRDVSLHDAKPEHRQKFKEFRDLLKKEQEFILTYRSLRDLELAIRFNMPQVLERFPVQGWVRPQGVRALYEELEQLKAQIARLESKEDKSDKVEGIDKIEKIEAAPILINAPKVSMNERFSFDYRIHAYQDGNFKELMIKRHTTWGHILAILGPAFLVPSLEELFSKRLGEYLNDVGLADAQRFMPRAHAVARAQMNASALTVVKNQLQQNEWIVQIGRDDRQRVLWQLTPKAQKLLDSNLLDSDRVFQLKPLY